MTSAERRAAIIETAVDLFSQNGFRGTTTRELAAAGGVSEPVLYQHFATKRDLYTAIVEYMVEQTTARFECDITKLPENATDEQYFRWLGEQMWRWYEEDERFIRLLLFSGLEGHELADLWHEKAMAAFFSQVHEGVQARIAAGELRDAHPVLATKAFLGAVAHTCMMAMLFKCDIGAPKDQVLQEFVDIYLNGLRRRAS